ncbi:hypothetical protein AB6A40_010745 [Gnathostoma spinigerum]|uniref:Uncharacterized protein n=1 Tax=Gnathostoma spinigerum TaxID=75299 RepID=A0ABD6EVW1_9BILA
MVNTVGEEDSSASVFKGHLNEVRCTAVNHDGSLLASGDASGLYCVWDVLNGQCLRSQQTKGPICNLSFIIGWKKPNERVKYRKEVMRSLQRQPRANSFVRVIHLLDEPIETSGSEEHSKRYNLDAYLERLRLQESSYEISRTTRERTDTKDEHTVAESDHAEQARLDSSKLDEVVASLKARIAYLEKYNREIYTFAASKILEK